ncbi:MAG: MarP family serine protease [Naasia sp.]
MLAAVVDIVLVVALIAYLVYGARAGLLRSIFAIAGVVAGGVGAILLLPLVTQLIPDQTVRIIAGLLLVLALLTIGSTVGGMLGRALSDGVARGPLKVIDRALGAVVGLVVSALVASMVAFGVGALGVPVLTPALASSSVLRGIDSLTPTPVKGAMAQLRSLVIQDGIPRITEALGGPTSAPDLPDLDTGTDALDTAALSVVRITGNAYACGQSQTGSGFVVAPDRIVTNAHVVSGVDEPIVESRQDGTVTGRVVYFDPIDDIAVIATDDLPTAPLPAAATLGPDAEAAFLGFPFGGPFAAKPATVISVGSFEVDDIYGDTSTPREVYTLAADVQQGNSGGPLLGVDGSVVGIVFATSATTQNVGYAATMTELGPVLEQAASLTEPVSAGACSRG